MASISSSPPLPTLPLPSRQHSPPLPTLPLPSRQHSPPLSVPFLHSPHPHNPLLLSDPFLPQRPGLLRCRAIPRGEARLEGPPSKRREALIQLLSAVAFPSLAGSSSAETDAQQEFRVYEDDANKFKISVPRDWLIGQGETDGIRSLTAFYPEKASDSNVSIAITGIGPDFTRLESFGNVDAFAENLVNGLDRSWKRPPGVAAKLINAKAANGLYYIEYTLQNPGERRRHLIAAIGMASNGWVNRLYTVTGQFIDDESEMFRSRIQNSVSSFRFIK